MDQARKLDIEELRNVVGGSMREEEFTESDQEWLLRLIETAKEQEWTLERLLPEMAKMAYSDESISFVETHWDS